MNKYMATKWPTEKKQTDFYKCTKLSYIKCLATNISPKDCTYIWVYKVANTGTFVKAASMSTWTTGDNGIPKGWTVINE